MLLNSNNNNNSLLLQRDNRRTTFWNDNNQRIQTISPSERIRRTRRLTPIASLGLNRWRQWPIIHKCKIETYFDRSNTLSCLLLFTNSLLLAEETLTLVFSNLATQNLSSIAIFGNIPSRRNCCSMENSEIIPASGMFQDILRFTWYGLGDRNCRPKRLLLYQNREGVQNLQKLDSNPTWYYSCMEISPEGAWT